MNAFWNILTFLSLLMSSCALYLLIDVVKELRKDLDHEIALRRDLEHKFLKINDSVDENTLKIIDLNKKIKQMEENKK